MESKELKNTYSLGIDIGSTTVKVAVLSPEHDLLFADYRRHFADIQGTLADLVEEAEEKLHDLDVSAVITGSGGLTLAGNMDIRLNNIECIDKSFPSFLGRLKK
jgi:activator of 2-hydroxyglutaryl-CoA dehydratase